MKSLLEKVRLVGLRQHYGVLMRELQKRGVAHFVENEAFETTDESFSVQEFDAARVQFFINFLSKEESAKGVLEGGALTGGKMVMSEDEMNARAARFADQADELITAAEQAEEARVRTKNEKKMLTEKVSQVAPYVGLGQPMRAFSDHGKVVSWVGQVSDIESLSAALAEETPLVDVLTVNQNESSATVQVVAHSGAKEVVQSVLNEMSFAPAPSDSFAVFGVATPAEIVDQLQAQIAEQDKVAADAEATINGLVEHINDARIYADVVRWGSDRAGVDAKVMQTKSLFAVDAWVPESEAKGLEDWLQKAFVGGVEMEAVEPEEGEQPPALLQNSVWRPFEMLTNMYGSPTKNDIDPTPFLSPWFVLFFGICLSDVGYGLMLALTGGFFLAAGTFDHDMKDTLRLVFYCGISAVIGGILLGGYFGLTPDQAPAFMTTMRDGSLLFKGQILNATEGNGPLQFLIFSCVVGVVQLLSGVLVEAYKFVKQGRPDKAILDSGAWFFFLCALIAYALAATGSVSQIPLVPAKWAAIAGAIVLILTQGREEKNIIMKPLMGVLGLYGVMNYLSDILSYSRLMALGLATGVIANAMNTTAGVLYEMVGVPGLAHLVAVVVLVFGHGLNFGLSLLGAAIHSMRLQFIEFFGRFYTGGAQAFAPLKRRMEHILLRS